MAGHSREGKEKAAYEVERLGRALRDERASNLGNALAGAEMALLRVYEEFRHVCGFSSCCMEAAGGFAERIAATEATLYRRVS